MRATEILRGILDIIDDLDDKVGQGEQTAVSAEEYYDDETRRMNQIKDLIPDELGTYDNSPVANYASIEAVTINAGGGTSAPKHPADIRADSIAMYPGAQNVR